MQLFNVCELIAGRKWGNVKGVVFEMEFDRRRDQTKETSQTGRTGLIVSQHRTRIEYRSFKR